MTDYAVFIEATELVPFEDSLPTATDDAAVRALPHKVASCTHMLHVLHAHIHTCVFEYCGITGGLPANQLGSDGPRTFHRVHGNGAAAKRQGLGISVE